MDNNLISCFVGILVGAMVGIILFYIYDKSRIIYHGPNSKNIIIKIYKKNGKCYRLIPSIVICPSYLSMNKFK